MKRSGTVWLMLLCLAKISTGEEERPFLLGADPPLGKTVERRGEKTEFRRTQWWMFTAEWCAPCRSARGDFEAWLKQSGWQVDDTPSAHVRLIDADRERKLVQEFGIRVYPTFLLMQDGRELQRLEAYPGRDELVRRYQEAAFWSEPAMRAISLGTITGQRDNIAQLIAQLRPLLGTNGSMTVKLDRAANPSVRLPISNRFSVQTDNPLMMTYSMKDDVLTCRFAPPYPRVRFVLGLPLEQSVSAMSISVSEVMFELTGAPDLRLNVQP